MGIVSKLCLTPERLMYMLSKALVGTGEPGNAFQGDDYSIITGTWLVGTPWLKFAAFLRVHRIPIWKFAVPLKVCKNWAQKFAGVLKVRSTLKSSQRVSWKFAVLWNIADFHKIAEKTLAKKTFCTLLQPYQKPEGVSWESRGLEVTHLNCLVHTASPKSSKHIHLPSLNSSTASKANSRRLFKAILFWRSKTCMKIGENCSFALCMIK